MAYTYLSLEDLSVDMVVRIVFPSLNTSTINVRWKPKVRIARWTDLNTVTISEWDREIN
jgi:hypothetical protein